MRKSTIHPLRRDLIKGSAAALGVLGLASWAQALFAQPAPEAIARPLPAHARWKKHRAMIVHSGNSLETRVRHSAPLW